MSTEVYNIHYISTQYGKALSRPLQVRQKRLQTVYLVPISDII